MEQEYFARFGVVVFLLILIFAISSCERSIILEEVQEMKKTINELKQGKNYE